MGEYLPPPYGLLQLAAYVEKEVADAEIDVVDCQAMSVDWHSLQKRMESFNPHIIAVSGFATCNVYVTARTLEAAKRVNPEILTITGGQHFTSTAQESLEAYPEIDIIARGEGEQTLAELVKTYDGKQKLANIEGISFRHNGRYTTTPQGR